MYFSRKLRSPALGTEGILGILSISAFMFLMILSFKLAMGFGALICFIAAFVTLIILIRTKNMYFLALLMGQIFATTMMSMVAILNIEAYKYAILPIAGLMGISFTLAIIFTFQRKLKWRSREMLELAAQPVQERTNGLTQRPLPAGHLEYSPEEISKFSSFVRRTLIAIPLKEESRTIFILNVPLGRLLTFNNRYDDRTWVAFGKDGDVTVSISQQDYFMYRDLLAFDQLCQSLGDLFIEFATLYFNGQEQQIMYRLNALNLNIITEG